ncbi:MAG: multi-sensor signal transduction histidine kinase [Pedosphaera sp.]|nr:multi-sensor signal transduction histidine kinase [Pedosphaera sp.]
MLFQSNPLPMWVYDVGSLAFLAVNDAAIRHYGYSREEFLGMTILDIRPLEDIPRLKELLPTLPDSSGSLSNSGVWRHRKKDGTIIDVEVSSQLVSFEGHTARLVLVQDVTQLKSSTEQVHLLQACISRLSDVVIITEAEPLTEPGPRIVFVNEAFEKRTGYTAAEAIGRSPRFLQGPGTNRAARARIWRALEGRRAIREEIINYTKSGEEIWLEMELAPVFNEAGVCTHFVSIERDITERKRAERTLQESEARLKEAQRVANIGSWEWNLSQRKVIWSDELYRIFGLAPQSVAITAETFLKCIHPEERQTMFRKVEMMRQNPQPFTETYRIVQPGGVVRHVLAHGDVATDGNAKTLRMMGTVQDITERKQAEEDRIRSVKLEAANRELEAFSYSVSHDLRAPLRTIDGFSKMLAEDYGARLDDTGKGYLELIQGAARRMGQLIQDLLELSQITSTQMRRTNVDLTALVTDIAREARQADPARPVDFTVAAGLTVNADPRLLRIALENLVRNAWKFTGKTPQPRVEFGVIRQEAETVYFIRDNGAGFDMEFVNKLFGVFQRLHREAEFTGTGVGLAIVQRIIHRHGGRIWAEGAVNQGAIFYFTLSG